MEREDSYENSLGEENQGSIPKWRRRNLAHHLAGERRRRQSRKARVMQLGELLPNVGKDAALNRVLECAVASIRTLLGRASGSENDPTLTVVPTHSESPAAASAEGKAGVKGIALREVLLSSSKVGVALLSIDLMVQGANMRLAKLLHQQDPVSVLKQDFSSFFLESDREILRYILQSGVSAVEVLKPLPAPPPAARQGSQDRSPRQSVLVLKTSNGASRSLDIVVDGERREITAFVYTNEANDPQCLQLPPLAADDVAAPAAAPSGDPSPPTAASSCNPAPLPGVLALSAAAETEENADRALLVPPRALQGSGRPRTALSPLVCPVSPASAALDPPTLALSPLLEPTEAKGAGLTPLLQARSQTVSAVSPGKLPSCASVKLSALTGAVGRGEGEGALFAWLDEQQRVVAKSGGRRSSADAPSALHTAMAMSEAKVLGAGAGSEQPEQVEERAEGAADRVRAREESSDKDVTAEDKQRTGAGGNGIHVNGGAGEEEEAGKRESVWRRTQAQAPTAKSEAEPMTSPTGGRDGGEGEGGRAGGERGKEGDGAVSGPAEHSLGLLLAVMQASDAA